MKGLDMVTYKKRKSTWSLIVGWIVFFVAIGVTFADVYGG